MRRCELTCWHQKPPNSPLVGVVSFRGKSVDLATSVGETNSTAPSHWNGDCATLDVQLINSFWPFVSTVPHC